MNDYGSIPLLLFFEVRNYLCKKDGICSFWPLHYILDFMRSDVGLSIQEFLSSPKMLVEESLTDVQAIRIIESITRDVHSS